MANCIARCIGTDRTGRTKESTRLGSHTAEGQANTWSTFASAVVWADGHGYVEVKQNGRVIHRFDFGPESEPPQPPRDEIPADEVVETMIGS